MARVACEAAVTTGLVFVMGEITTSCYVDIPKVVRDTVRDIGYDRAKYGFDCDTCSVITSIDEQSPDIAMGVNKALEYRDNNGGDNDAGHTGAGDREWYSAVPAMKPRAYADAHLPAHKLAKRLTDARKQGIMLSQPDGKTQVTVEYENGRPVRVDTVVVSAQHSPDVDYQEIKKDILEHVIKPVIPGNLLDENTRYFINPTGRFVVGGPQGDSGLTGRKIIVDTYGGMGRHGGGAFSGKDHKGWTDLLPMLQGTWQKRGSGRAGFPL